MMKLQQMNRAALIAILGILATVCIAGCAQKAQVTAVNSSITTAASQDKVTQAGVDGLKKWLNSQPGMSPSEKQMMLKNAEAQEARTTGQAPAAQ